MGNSNSSGNNNDNITANTTASTATDSATRSNSSRRLHAPPSIPNPGPVAPAPQYSQMPLPPGYPSMPPGNYGPSPYPPAPSSYYQNPPYQGGPPTQWYGGPSYAPNPQQYAPYYSPMPPVQTNGGWAMHGGSGPRPYYPPAPPGALPPPQPPVLPPPPPPPPFAEPQRTTTIRNDVNVKRNTLKLEEDPENPGHWLLSFSYDATVAGSLVVFLHVREGEGCSFSAMNPNPFLYQPRKWPFKAGLGQKFRMLPGQGLPLAALDESDLTKVGPGEVYPLVIRTEALNPSKTPPKKDPKEEDDADVVLGRETEAWPGGVLPAWVQSQSTYGVFVRGNGGEFVVKAVKQKIWVDGMRYELQEIYGIEQSNQSTGDKSEEDDISGKECVICMSEPRDTTVLPCRHMCMCRECAKVLRFQDNRCPICRQVVERLLEIHLTPQTETKEA